MSKEVDMSRAFRIGYGYDVHRLADGLPLTIGGVKIEHIKGAVAHSDGDVLIHAICDALFGALALGDIGLHFPDTSNEFKDIDSKILLQRSYDIIKKKGYCIGNIDSMLTLERPKIRGYVDEMRKTIAEILDVEIEDISIKATTKEGLDSVGNELGVEASATLLLFRI